MRKKFYVFLSLIHQVLVLIQPLVSLYFGLVAFVSLLSLIGGGKSIYFVFMCAMPLFIYPFIVYVVFPKLLSKIAKF